MLISSQEYICATYINVKYICYKMVLILLYIPPSVTEVLWCL